MLLVFFTSFTLCFGQTVGRNSYGARPFGPGEVLQYEVKLNKFLNGISVADLNFVISKPPGSEHLLIRSHSKSKGTLLKLARYSFLQQYETLVHATDFRVLSTKKHDVQKDRIRDSEALFDYKVRRVTYIESDPQEPMRPPRKIASAIDNPVYDLVSGVYYLRTLPLAVGKSFELTLSDSGLVYRIPVRVTARERQKSVLGTVWCFRVEPEVFGPNRLIEREGSMVIWITDDAKRVPVRSQINSHVGKIEVRLKSMNGHR